MNFERQPRSHHRGPRHVRRSGRDARPRRVGELDVPDGQLAGPKFTLNLAVMGPAGSKPDQPGQRRSRLAHGKRALRFCPIGLLAPVIECP
jgi:hypothetical protein